MRFANPLFLILTAVVPVAGLFWAFLRARLLPPGANLWGLQAWCIVLRLSLSLFAASRSVIRARYQFFLLPGLAFLLAGAALSKGRFGGRRVVR